MTLQESLVPDNHKASLLVNTTTLLVHVSILLAHTTVLQVLSGLLIVYASSRRVQINCYLNHSRLIGDKTLDCIDQIIKLIKDLYSLFQKIYRWKEEGRAPGK